MKLINIEIQFRTTGEYTSALPAYGELEDGTALTIEQISNLQRTDSDARECIRQAMLDQMITHGGVYEGELLQ